MTQSAATPLETTLSRLRSLSQRSIQATWRTFQGADPGALPPNCDDGPIAPLNDRGHVAWDRGQQVIWLMQSWVWPSDLNGYPLVGMQAKLALRWWADQADIYLNGQPVQSGDLFDCFGRVPLTAWVEPGETVQVALRLVSPGHDDGALVRSHLIFESPTEDWLEPGFVADELAVLHRYLSQFAPEKLAQLTAALDSLDWSAVSDRKTFNASLTELRQQLAPLSDWIKQRQIHCVGHAHLDLAWLWPIADTWEAAQRTFRSVLNLQQAFPELTYTHSSPALFAWLEEHQPALFRSVQAQVKAGRWSIDAGLWVEPELNTISGESIARQLLYGQRYCQEKFGAVSPIAWLPDSFGFNAQLPQIFQQGGIRYFATQKLRWNDTHDFPHDWFWWQGLDGTRLLSLTLPPIGSDLDPLAMADYACTWEQRTGLPASLWLPGVGDHGGGPTRDMLEQQQRWAASPFFPQLDCDHPVAFLQRIEPTEPADLPLWTDELYLELHRGCYTTHADQKWYNRRCEDGLYEAELWATLATLVAQAPYPKAELETAWKQALFNQFHDILPGSAIPEVYAEANPLWQSALAEAHRLRQQAQQAIAAQITLPTPPTPQAQPVVIFNPLNWDRTELVTISLPEASSELQWQARDWDGTELPSRLVENCLSETGTAYPPQVPSGPQLLVQVPAVPSLGYRLIWLVPSTQQPISDSALPAHWRLENEYLQATVDPATGDLSRLYDKQHQRDVLGGAANQLQAFHDRGQYWDAWNIDPHYEQHPYATASLQSIQWIEAGPLRQRIRVVRRLGTSTFEQDYLLAAGSSRLDIVTQADWQETQVVVKAAFPLNSTAPVATYEIPFGAITRPTQNTPRETAKWEVPGLRWADLSDGTGGCSLLTESKHGFDAHPQQLRVTLLKAPLWPDPTADRGQHVFTLSLLPHSGDWSTAGTPQAAQALNRPLTSIFVPRPPDSQAPNASTLPASPHSFLRLSPTSLILAALKLAEDSPEAVILRCYEAHGQPAHLTLETALNLALVDRVTLLEEAMDADAHPLFAVHPWQVVSYRFVRDSQRLSSNF